MSCKKCTEIFVLENKPSTIYFISEFDELISKSHNFLKKLQIDVKEINGLICISVDDTEMFFIENLDALNTSFNSHEKNDIKLFIEDEKNSFTYQSMLLAKPLQRYINILEDKEFFDIINNESLTSHFQPIINMKDNSIYGYETLARGVREDGTLVYPDELFKKSKRNDLNFRLDRLCRESSLKTAATKKVHQKVFINFIPTSIYDPEYCLNSTVKWAKQLEFDPSQIVFEVVETELVKDQKHLKNILEYYRSKGFKIALDDVGEGYSSLNMLIELKPDIIKIDRNIIDGIDKNELKQSVYRALFNLAREHNITVLAEGVETVYELEMIKSIGVDLVQGYYFAKPTTEPIRKI
ncbi:MAG: EAL domain-containing protein [Poseidonibacter sp.]|uniref:EAL domain-containing protein n=1 Tax=Poseidonibacter sp. TaxID=2321188 RepID=UPI00359D3B4F